MTNKICEYCGTETEGMMSAFGDLHTPDCPIPAARALGESIAEALQGAFEKIAEDEGVDGSDDPIINRAILMDEAEATINGPRARDYGDAYENFSRIATGWGEILRVDVEPVQVALCMDWVKTCRLITSPHHRDSWIDKIGYSALGGEVAGR